MNQHSSHQAIPQSKHHKQQYFTTSRQQLPPDSMFFAGSTSSLTNLTQGQSQTPICDISISQASLRQFGGQTNN